MKFKPLKRPKIRVRRPRIRIRWRKRTSRRVIGAAILFFISLFALQLVLMNYTKSILLNVLNIQLQEATNGRYTSSFDRIEVSYTSKNLSIHNLRLFPKDSAESKSIDTPFSYEILIPEVEIKGLNLRKAYLQGILDISSLNIRQPKVLLSANLDQANDESSLALFKKDLYKSLPKAIKELSIGSFRLLEGTLELKVQRKQKKSLLNLSSFNMELKQFHLDEGAAEKADQVFYSENFLFEAGDLKGRLADGLYSFHLQSLRINSKDSVAFADNLVLLPLQQPEEVAKNKRISNLYQLEFPQLYLYGLSLTDLFRSGDLMAKEVTILSPGVRLISLQPLSPVQKESIRPEKLYSTIEKVLNSVQIQNLYLRNGQLEISELEDGVRQKMLAKIQLAHIGDFALDSTSHQQKDQLLYAGEINLDLLDYSLRLSDELHLLQADELHLSSGKKTISAKGFRILPDSGSTRINEDIPNYFASAPGIFLDGVDLQQAVHSNRLFIDSLLLQQPSFTLTPSSKRVVMAEKHPEKKGFHEEDLYALVKDYLFSLNIERITMLEGKVNIKQTESPASDAFLLNISHADLWNFRLDSASAYQLNKLFYADDFELEIENYQHDLPDNIHTISAGRVAVSTISDQIHLKDVFIQAEGLDFPFTGLPSLEAKTLLNLHVPELNLFGADILKAYLYKQLEVEKVIIPFPILRLGTLLSKDKERSDIIKSSALYELIKDRLEVIKVEELELQEGSVNIALHDTDGRVLSLAGQQVSVQMDHFLFDSLTAAKPRYLFYSEEFEIQVKDYETQFSDGIHVLHAENLKASTLLEEISAENIRISNSKEAFTDEELLVSFRKKDFLKMELPHLRLSGLDFHEAYREEALEIDSVLAIEPTVLYTYLSQPGIDKKKQEINLRESGIYRDMAPYLQALFIRTVLMEGGNFYVHQQENNKSREQIAIEEASLLLHQFQLDSSALEDTAPFLYSDKLWLDIDSYRQQLLGQRHILSAENISLSTSENVAEAHAIQIKPVPAPPLNNEGLLISAEEQIFLELPHLQLVGIRFDSLFKNEHLYTESIILQRPSLKLRQYKGLAQKKDTSVEFNPLTLLSEKLKSIFVKEVKINDGHLSYTRKTNGQQVHLKANQFNGLVERFHLTEEEDHPPFYAENIELSVQDFQRNLGDSLHLLTIDELRFSTAEELLSVQGLLLRPRILPDLQEQMKQKGASTLFNVTVPLTQITGIKADQLKEDSLLLQQIVIQSPEIEVLHFPELEKDKEVSHHKTDQWQQDLLRYFKLLKAESAAIKDGSFAFTTLNGEERNSLRVKNINALAKDILFDSLSRYQPNPLLLADYVELEVEDYTSTLDHELYGLAVEKLRWNSREKDLIVDSLSITPLLDRVAFAERKGYETDQYTFRNKQLKLQNFQLDLLLEEGKFAADSLLVDGFYLFIFRDKRQPYPENHFPPMPQSSIRNLDVPFFIGGVAVRNAYIGYAERVKGTKESGFIDLTDVLVLGDTISNYPQLLEKGITTNLYLNAQLMGKGDLSAYFEIPLNDSLNRHTFYGRLGAMDLTEFNPILERTVFVKIKSGYADQIDFYVEADRNNAEGSMEFIYNDLQVALVNKRTGKTNGPVKQLASLIANAFLVDSENIAVKDEPIRKGEIAFERDETHSTVNYWIKTLVNGFKSSIGL